jgi:hypothetical protein
MCVQHVRNTSPGGTVLQDTILLYTTQLRYLFCNNSDNTLLNEKLEQLPTLDCAIGYTRV